MTSQGAWWYNLCHHSNLNGINYNEDGILQRGIIWQHWRGAGVSLREAEMAITPKGIYVTLKKALDPGQGFAIGLALFDCNCR